MIDAGKHRACLFCRRWSLWQLAPSEMRVFDAKNKRQSGPMALIRNGKASPIKMTFYLCSVCAYLFDNDALIHHDIVVRAAQIRAESGL